MTEQQPYNVVRTFEDFELRRYPDYALVQVDVAGDFGRAANAGFGPLFRYISGSNEAAARIPMTAPVLQETRSESSHTVSFVLPSGTDAGAVPLPAEARVSVRNVAAHLAAARKFSGAWSEARFAENGQALLKSVRREGLTPVGGLYYARYDPPWKPGFFKRNEALTVVADVQLQWRAP